MINDMEESQFPCRKKIPDDKIRNGDGTNLWGMQRFMLMHSTPRCAALNAGNSFIF
jgi:hypothetical protein